MSKNLKRINYTRTFLRQFKKAPLQIKIAFRERLAIFLENPFFPQLNNHSLTGKLKGYRSINIAGDWRAIFSEVENQKGEKIVILETLGTHSQLYK